MIASLRPHSLVTATLIGFNQIHERGTPTENRHRADPKTYHRENFGTIAIDWDQSDPEIQLQILDLDGVSQIEKRLRLSDLK